VEVIIAEVPAVLALAATPASPLSSAGIDKKREAAWAGAMVCALDRAVCSSTRGRGATEAVDEEHI